MEKVLRSALLEQEEQHHRFLSFSHELSCGLGWPGLLKAVDDLRPMAEMGTRETFQTEKLTNSKER
jgi:hypothetical protein